MDNTFPIEIATAVHPHEKTLCPWVVVLEGQECECPVRGVHQVHRYRTRSGVRHEIEFMEPGP